MKRIATAIALLGATACARAAAPASTPAPAVAPPPSSSAAAAETPAPPRASVAIRIPRTVAGFSMKARRDYEDRALGTQLRYEAADSTIADVYIYPGPDLASDCPMECAKTAIATEAKTFESGFPEMIRLGYVQAIGVTAREELAPPSGAAWQLGQHLTMAVTRDSLAQRSELYLFYVPRYRVKIRATYVETPERLAAIRAFASELVPALTRP